MRIVIWPTVVFLLLVSSNASSGTIDLSIEINPSIIHITEAVEIGEFSITLTNHGPDAAGSSSPLSFPISIDTERIYFEEGQPNVGFMTNPDIIDDCVFYPFIIDPVPGDPPSIIYSFFTPVVPAGESITCYGLYSVYSENQNGTRVIEWSPFSGSDNDTDFSNDIALMTFRGYVAPVPSLSLWAIILLALSILLMSFRFKMTHKKHNFR